MSNDGYLLNRKTKLYILHQCCTVLNFSIQSYPNNTVSNSKYQYSFTYFFVSNNGSSPCPDYTIFGVATCYYLNCSEFIKYFVSITDIKKEFVMILNDRWYIRYITKLIKYKDKMCRTHCIHTWIDIKNQFGEFFACREMV